jgi:ribonuclease-3
MSEVPEQGIEARLDAAERLANHRFVDRELLLRALTHPSYTEEPHAAQDYERLEFLGDAVLGLVVVHEIFQRFPRMPEGQMTKLKIGVVAGRTLSDAADDLGLGRLLLLGPSETGTDGRGMTSALEDGFEALVGAIYLDAGLETAREFIHVKVSVQDAVIGEGSGRSKKEAEMNAAAAALGSLDLG